MKPVLWIMAGAACVALAGCGPAPLKGPKERNVCFHVGFPKDQPPKFNVIKKDVPSLEYCAAHLDALRIKFLSMGSPRKEIVGVYNGTFLWSDGRGVKIGQSYEGARIPLLTKAPDGRLVVPGAFEVPEKTDFSDVQTLPENLPEKK
ncbi:hypothetical protein [Asticcacaulis sp. AND118]|uniref:hypothetical protein n=1 Tax=Asticcacaulis sp. AND118 TaxID=2840468 RepID=UPI001CFFFC34|nr:hypothetical protein [Asticcacaulis sp. AND118]UDF04655.1 hypothetical protein LH365_06340 [Asticcacaulis sp. AND118]